MDTKRAFTIWELLTVIAIIALLMFLIMPAMDRARSQATHLICRSYLRGYAMAGLAYLKDNDGLFPSPASEWLYTEASISEEHPIGCRWHDQAMGRGGQVMSESPQYQGKMWDYIGRGSLGICPIFRGCAPSRGCENPDHNQDLDIRPRSSYTMNAYLGSERDGGVLRESEVRDPSTVFFFAEENSWSVRPDHPRFPARWLSAPLSTGALDDTILLIRPGSEAGDCFATYHRPPSEDLSRGSGYVAFVDGHVDSINAEDQLRKNMHGGESRLGPAGNLSWAWAAKSPPPGGWDAQ
jgi:prepilin-type processing-associated H-X9-DG protein